MIAIEIQRPGGPEVLQPCERDVPFFGPNDLLIHVEAAGVARADILQRQGKYPPPPGASDIPGLDVAGVVEQVGAQVTTFKPHDRVCAILSGGGYAEYVSVPALQVLPTPESWTSVEAATLPENLFTVFDNVVTRAGLRAGESILIHGGTSGIGTMAVMLARLLQAIPYVTAGSDSKCDAALRLGAEAAINYKEKDFAVEIQRLTGKRGVDVVLDMVGAPYLERNIQSLAPDGRITMVATQGGFAASLDLRQLMAIRARLMGAMLRARTPEQKGQIRDRLQAEVWPHLAGKRWIKPLVDCTFPLAEASRAHQRMEDGGHIGKIVLTI